MPDIFKDRVRNIAINEARNYKQNFVDYQYLICSDAFQLKDYYIIDARTDNYQHLLGINSLIAAQDFYDKCYDGSLQETDFNFIKIGQDEKSVKGSVRRKIQSLPNMMNIFQSGNILVEETFVKNHVMCNIATSNLNCTLGFIDVLTCRPKSLLKGNELNLNRAKDVKLLLRKHNDKDKYDEIIIGNDKTIKEYHHFIADLLDNKIVPTI